MAIYKCKMCGNTLNVEEGQSVVACDACGTQQTVHSFDNEKKISFFKRANTLRFKNEFDKASGIFETIVSEFPDEAEAYWGLVLCKYGIEYVDDPKTGEKIPTCHRSQFVSIFDDADYKKAITYADAAAEAQYKKEAREIAKLQKNILEISSKEDPFDIFICYKETDSKGERTLDSVLAQDIYKELTNEGYRVFFSRITLEDKLGSQYEPYIFAALHSAKIMLHVTTKDEHSESVWVRNEWSRFLDLIRNGDKKTLIPCYKNMSPYELPDEMQNLQGQDMSKIGALQDLVYGVNKIIGKQKTTTVVNTVNVESRNNVSNEQEAYESLLRKGYVYLSKKLWKEATETFESAVKIVEKCGRGYLGLILAKAHETSFENLLNNKGFEGIDKNLYDLAGSFADDKCAEELNNLYSIIYNHEYSTKMNKLKEFISNEYWKSARKLIEDLVKDIDREEFWNLYYCGLSEFISKEIDKLNQIKHLSSLDDLDKQIEELDRFEVADQLREKSKLKREQLNQNYINDFVSKCQIAIPEKATLDTIKILCTKITSNTKSLDTLYYCYEPIKEKVFEINDGLVKYLANTTIDICNGFTTLSECTLLDRLIRNLKRDDDFRKSYVAIQNKATEINIELKRLKKKHQVRNLKISGILCAGIAVIIGVSFAVKAIQVANYKKNTYEQACNYMESGDYESAKNYYNQLGDYEKSQSKIKVCDGMIKIEGSIKQNSISGIKNGITDIINAGEKVDIKYFDDSGHKLKRINQDEKLENYTVTVDDPNFDFYIPIDNGGYTFCGWNGHSSSYANDRAKVVLKSVWSLNRYHINYILNGGTNNASNRTEYTIESPTFSLENAYKEHYVFKGWYDSSDFKNQVLEIKQGTYGDITLYAKWEIQKFDVSFYNENTLLQTVKVEYGGTAVYTGTTPTKEKTAQYSYKFNGWDKSLSNITKSFSTYAQFSSSINSYTVRFLDYDKVTILDTCSVKYGSCAQFTKSTPIREPDNNYAYNFSQWDKPLTTVITQDTDFYAVYSTTNRYLCRFFVNDIETYKTFVTEGDNVSYPFNEPTKEPDKQYSYSFKSWDKPLTTVITQDTDFYAVFDSVLNKYTVTFLDWDGSLLDKQICDYGSYPQFSSSTPERYPDNNFAYYFKGWDKSLNEPVTEDTIFIAQYSTKNRYLCSFYNYDETLLYYTYVTEGDDAVYKGEVPKKESTQQYTFVFNNWDKSLSNITKNTVFHALFTNTINKYTVTFVNYDGTIICSSSVDYGSSCVYTGLIPKKPIEDRTEYFFDGWDISLDSITSNCTATAVYRDVERYQASFYSYYGTLLYSEYVTKGYNASYVGDLPTRDSTQQYSYSFSSWDKSLLNIQNDICFYPLFSETVNKYTVSFVNYNGDLLGKSVQDYGANAIYNGDLPSKPDSLGCSYIFNGWDASLENITRDITITAVYSQVVNDIEYELNEDRTGYIISKYNGTADELDLTGVYNDLPVVEIGENSFDSNTYISKVYIPSTIVKISKEAFADSSISNVVFKDVSNLTTICSKAFYRCKGLLDSYSEDNAGGQYLNGIIIPSSVTYIEEDAFYYHYNIGTNWNYWQWKYLFCFECNFNTKSTNCFGYWDVYGRPGSSYQTYTYSYRICIFGEKDMPNPMRYCIFNFDQYNGLPVLVECNDSY